MRFVWVGIGGAIGSMIRYAFGLGAVNSRFPWTTLFINISGSFALGFLLTWGLGRWSVTQTTAVAVGLLGGFTTFSAFAWEGLFLTRSGRTGLAIGYLLLSVLGGVAAAWMGYTLGRSLR
jgi:CrcB protein